jgi:predicted metal-dependent peptidase
MLALIEVMSDQELINNLGSLRKRGVFDNPEMKKVVEERLEKAKTGKRVAAMKSMEAIKAAGVGEDIQKKLSEVADTQVKARGTIKRATALLIDKSGSMSQAIELGKQIGTMISAITEAPLYVYAFDTMAYPITSTGKDLASWEKALRGINAGGGTSCGVALEYMIRNRQVAETIILITDEGENSTPAFVPTLKKYRETLKVEPGVVIVKTQGASNLLEMQAQREGVNMDAYQFSGDYYSLPNLIPFLTRPGRLDLLMDIMSYELPNRKTA